MLSLAKIETQRPPGPSLCHRAPGLKGDELVQNAPHVPGAKIAVFKQIYVNVGSGFIVSVFEVDSKEKLEEQMEVLGFPIEETHEVHFAACAVR